MRPRLIDSKILGGVQNRIHKVKKNSIDNLNSNLNILLFIFIVGFGLSLYSRYNNKYKIDKQQQIKNFANEVNTYYKEYQLKKKEDKIKNILNNNKKTQIFNEYIMNNQNRPSNLVQNKDFYNEHIILPHNTIV